MSANPSRRTFLTHLTAATVFGWPGNLPAQTRLDRGVFDVRRYGGLGDGQTLDTRAIQRAIDAASQAGGGIVAFTPGRYVTGTLLLKSGVTLDLDKQATLLGSLNPADYHLIEAFVDGVGATRGYALIGCVDGHNVGITGAGTIDGRGAALQAAAGNTTSKEPSARPFLVLWLRSSAIAVKGVHLINSSAWTMHIFQCTDVSVAGISIRSLGLANNDGIDIDSSRSVDIEDCFIETGDDAICLKTTSTTPCTDIAVKACTMTTRCAAFKIGTESAGDFSAIRVSDCHVIQANLGAVKILSVDGANISDVVVERMTVDDADTPIFLRLGARGRSFRAGEAARGPGTLSNIVIRDMDVKSARRIGILISGLPGHVVEDVSLERISMQISGEPTALLPPEPAEYPAAYPEVRMFGASLPAFGVYGRHLRNLRMTAVKNTGVPGDARPEQLFSDDHS